MRGEGVVLCADGGGEARSEEEEAAAAPSLTDSHSAGFASRCNIFG